MGDDAKSNDNQAGDVNQAVDPTAAPAADTTVPAAGSATPLASEPNADVAPGAAVADKPTDTTPKVDVVPPVEEKKREGGGTGGAPATA